MIKCNNFKKVNPKDLIHYKIFSEDYRFLSNITGICLDRCMIDMRLEENKKKNKDFYCLLINDSFCRICKKLDYQCPKCKELNSLEIQKSNLVICTKCNNTFLRNKLEKYNKRIEFKGFEKGYKITKKVDYKIKEFEFNGDIFVEIEEKD